MHRIDLRIHPSNYLYECMYIYCPLVTNFPVEHPLLHLRQGHAPLHSCAARRRCQHDEEERRRCGEALRLERDGEHVEAGEDAGAEDVGPLGVVLEGEGGVQHPRQLCGPPALPRLLRPGARPQPGAC